MSVNVCGLLAIVGLSAVLVGSPTAAGQVAGAVAAPAAKIKRPKKPLKVYPAVGSIERLDPAIHALIPPETKVEKLVGGLQWAEGPVWDRRSRTLLFSDVPRNVVFEWLDSVGTRDYVFPSGYTGAAPSGGEPGSNGLTIDSQGRLVLCQHGDRRIARLEKNRQFTTLAEYYKNRRFNSPNDLVYHSNGDLYFTDPPYGLAGQNQDPAKELLFNGVYLLRKSGELALLTSELSFPNGIAFAPDEKTLYVAVSDPARPVIMRYALKPEGTLDRGSVFFDASSLAKERKGLPDGLKVDLQGNVFATGPGGVLVLTPAGRHLGTITTGELTANCAWGDDGSSLYITANTSLCRVKTGTKGKMP